jgi:hypothetical protein
VDANAEKRMSRLQFKRLIEMQRRLSIGLLLALFCLSCTEKQPKTAEKRINSAVYELPKTESGNSQMSNTGECSVTLDGVVYPFDKPPYSEATLKDETTLEIKFENGKDEYNHVKTGRRIILLMLNDTKNHHALSFEFVFNNQIGENITFNEDPGFLSSAIWSGQYLRGPKKGKVTITSLKKTEPYRYLFSGKFEREVTCESRKYQFTGEFKDLMIVDLEDPTLQGPMQKK